VLVHVLSDDYISSTVTFLKASVACAGIDLPLPEGLRSLSHVAAGMPRKADIVCPAPHGPELFHRSRARIPRTRTGATGVQHERELEKEFGRGGHSG